MITNDEDEPEGFAAGLRDGLQRLARQSPPGPRAVDVLASLRRRRRRRVIASAVALLVFGAAAALGLTLGTFRDRPVGRGAVRELVEALPEAAPATGPLAPAPLDPAAGAREIRGALGAVFKSLEVRNLVVEKQPGETISFAIGGSSVTRPDRLRGDLARLLVNFDSARIDVLDGDLSYTLMR